MHTWADYDRVLWSFLRRCSRSRAETTVAALERLHPPLKGKLLWARAQLSSLQVAAPVRHHEPMMWEQAVAVAWGCFFSGCTRFALDMHGLRSQ